uniref:Putative secreted protein n=1 Tax=Ixodes ricinus TaxID=34613 RepID=A0A6B0TTQ5_IXORI
MYIFVLPRLFAVSGVKAGFCCRVHTSLFYKSYCFRKAFHRQGFRQSNLHFLCHILDSTGTCTFLCIHFYEGLSSL